MRHQYRYWWQVLILAAWTLVLCLFAYWIEGFEPKQAAEAPQVRPDELFRQTDEVGLWYLAKDIFIGYLDVINEYITQEQYDRLKEMLSAMPDDLHMIHGDFQMKNVMLVDDEPMLIDMETIATGQPIFDLQALYLTYVAFGEDCPGNLSSFLGISDALGEPIWNYILENYFDTSDEAERSAINDKIKLLGMIRFLYLIAVTDMKNGELGEKRIRRAQQHIAELIGEVNDFMI